MVARQIVSSSSLPDRRRGRWRRGGEHRKRIRKGRLTVQTRSTIALSIFLKAGRNLVIIALLIVGLECRRWITQIRFFRQRCAILVLLCVQIHFVIVLNDELGELVGRLIEGVTLHGGGFAFLQSIGRVAGQLRTVAVLVAVLGDCGASLTLAKVLVTVANRYVRVELSDVLLGFLSFRFLNTLLFALFTVRRENQTELVGNRSVCQKTNSKLNLKKFPPPPFVSSDKVDSESLSASELDFSRIELDLVE